jgi:hypothetical protein
VFIERKGVRFRLSVEKPTGVRAASRARIDILDPVVSTGEWTWDWTPKGLTFRGKRRR